MPAPTGTLTGSIRYRDATIDRFQAELAKRAAEIERKILSIGSTLVGEGGKFDTTPTTLGRLAVARDQIVTALREGGYDGAVSTLLSGQLDMADAVRLDYERFIGQDVAFASADLSAFRAVVGAQFDQFADLGDEAANALKRGLTQAVTTGGSFESWGKELGLAMMVQPESVPRIFATAMTLARTATTQMHRKAMRRVDEKIGTDHWVYSGPEDEVTREFCQALMDEADDGTTWTEEEIDALDNSRENGGAGGGPGTAFEQGGGWNCRHIWEPVLPDEAKATDGGEAEPAPVEEPVVEEVPVEVPPPGIAPAGPVPTAFATAAEVPGLKFAERVAPHMREEFARHWAVVHDPTFGEISTRRDMAMELARVVSGDASSLGPMTPHGDWFVDDLPAVAQDLARWVARQGSVEGLEGSEAVVASRQSANAARWLWDKYQIDEDWFANSPILNPERAKAWLPTRLRELGLGENFVEEKAAELRALSAAEKEAQNAWAKQPVTSAAPSAELSAKLSEARANTTAAVRKLRTDLTTALRANAEEFGSTAGSDIGRSIRSAYARMLGPSQTARLAPLDDLLSILPRSITIRHGRLQFLPIRGHTAFARFENLSVNVNRLRGSAKTLWHEIGHTLEYQTFHIAERTKRFLADRIAAERAAGKSIQRYKYARRGLGERVWPDGFFDEYVGKVYSSEWTEVLSMGIQTLAPGAENELAQVIEKDPDHLLLALLVLLGR